MVKLFHFGSKSVNWWLIWNVWIFTKIYFFSQSLPLFTSLINTVFSYDPVGYVPYNYLLFVDTRESLSETAAQLLCVTLESNSSTLNDQISPKPLIADDSSNLFISYLSRIHRDDVRSSIRVLCTLIILLLFVGF